MSNHLFVPGRGLEFGLEPQIVDEVVAEASLNADSARRADTAADWYGVDRFVQGESLIYTVGGHPTLPAGATSLARGFSEGELMRRRIIDRHPIPAHLVIGEGDSTSSVTNVLNLLEMHGGTISGGIKAINPDNRMWIVAGKEHAKRFVNTFVTLGCMKSGIGIVPVVGEEDHKVKEFFMRGLSRGAAAVSGHDPDRLRKNDARLEAIHDKAAHTASSAIKIGRGLLRAA